jgi:mRNA interferase RelE/StbE
MQYEISVLPIAERELKRLPKNDLLRILRRIDGLSHQPRPHGVLKLQGSEDRYRLRQGNYRILYRIDDAAKRLFIYSIADRKDAYR